MGLSVRRQTVALALVVLVACVSGGHLPTLAQHREMNWTSRELAMKPREPASTAVIANAVIAGVSLATGTLMSLAQMDYRVTVAIQVENWTRYPLLYPTVRLHRGAVSTAPHSVLPGTREGFAVRKSSWSFSGTHGTVSWEVWGVKRRFVIMWDAPYSFLSHSNCMGIGMTPKGVTRVAGGNTWYHMMYDGQDGDNLKYKSRKYRDHMDSLSFSDHEFEIVGGMTNGHHAEIKIIFRTSKNNYRNLTPKIRKIMGHGK